MVYVQVLWVSLASSISLLGAYHALSSLKNISNHSTTEGWTRKTTLNSLKELDSEIGSAVLSME